LRKIVTKVSSFNNSPKILNLIPSTTGLGFSRTMNATSEMARGMNESDDEIPTTKLKEEPQW